MAASTTAFVLAYVALGHALGSYFDHRRSLVTAVVLVGTVLAVEPLRRALLHRIVRLQEVGPGAPGSGERTRILAEERARVGRDLHDGVAPLIAGAALAAEALRRGLPPGSADQRAAQQLVGRLRSVAGELRQVAHDLQPTALQGSELPAAVRHHVAAVAGTGLPHVTVDVRTQPLPPALETAVYRVVLEAVTNVVRHAGAETAAVHVAGSGDAVQVEVVDDGVGIPETCARGLGIRSMQSRVAAFGGDLSLRPRAGGGTVVHAELTLPP